MISKTIVVTGASRGIGKALVQELAADKQHHVIALSRDLKKMQQNFSALENVSSYAFDLELNVKEQVFDLAKTSIVQSAWKSGQELTLHGWSYGLNSGFVTDLNVNFSSNDDLDNVYQLKF